MADTKLIVVPTPIGNLSDVSIRVREALTGVDLIACEDTRTTGRLLKHLESKVPTISYHMHNERTRSPEILAALAQGKTVALVSDAGMPGVSDPGAFLIEEAIAQGFEVTVIPGPSAFVTALVGSGLPTDRFTFIGFLEKNRTKRKAQLEAIKDRQETLILYEAPHRLREFLNILQEVMGERRVCLARELSKLHEEYERGTLRELMERYATKEPRGEYVIILEGKPLAQIEAEHDEAMAQLTVEEHVKQRMAQGESKMEAVKQVAKDRGLPKNEVYMRVTDL